MNLKNLLPGALVVSGLLTACGGEVQELDNAQADTGIIESRETTSGPVCDEEYPVNKYPSGALSGCTLAASFTYQYAPGLYATARAGKYVAFTENGLVSAGWMLGSQSLYVGPGNGSVNLVEQVGFKTDSLETGRAWSGFLATDTCLKKKNLSGVICAGVAYNSSGGATNWLQFDAEGYVHVVSGSCTEKGTCTP